MSNNARPPLPLLCPHPQNQNPCKLHVLSHYEPLAPLRSSARLLCAKKHGAHSGVRLKKRFA